MSRLPPAQPDVDVYSSLALWERARKGDSGALNRLFARYLPRLHRWAHGRVPTWARDGADTADFVQETVLHTLRRLDAFEPERQGALLAYLRRALLNRIRDQFRLSSRRPHVGSLSDELAEEVAGDDESNERRDGKMVEVVMTVAVTSLGVIVAIAVAMSLGSAAIDIWRCVRGGRKRDFIVYVREDLGVEDNDMLSYVILWFVLCHYEAPEARNRPRT